MRVGEGNCALKINAQGTGKMCVRLLERHGLPSPKGTPCTAFAVHFTYAVISSNDNNDLNSTWPQYLQPTTMGNSKSQPKEPQVTTPRGDIFGPPKALFKFPRIPTYRFEPPKYTSSALQICEPRIPFRTPEVRTQPAITPSCYSTTAYQIWRTQLEGAVKPEQIDHYQADIDRHARSDHEFRKKLHRIKLERDKAESELYSNRVSVKPATSLHSICHLAKRYTNLSGLDMKYFSPKPDRPELTDDMLKVIDNASLRQPSHEVLVQIDSVNISRKDIGTLTGLNWLNDEVINAYMFLIVTRGKRPNYKSVYAFNTFFYPKLRESGYTSVKRWTRKVDIFSHDFLLIPVHLGNHWCLAVVDFATRTISYYDSLGGSPHGCCDTLLDYLRYESNDKKNLDFDDENWRLVNSYLETGIPKQQNGSDCGVFACTFAEYLTRKAKLNFTQEHMSYFRKKMIYELITKELLQ